MTTQSIEAVELLVPEMPGPDDTCDRCGPAVKAVAGVLLAGGGRLTFCGHCLDARLPWLASNGAQFIRTSR